MLTSSNKKCQTLALERHGRRGKVLTGKEEESRGPWTKKRYDLVQHASCVGVISERGIRGGQALGRKSYGGEPGTKVGMEQKRGARLSRNRAAAGEARCWDREKKKFEFRPGSKKKKTTQKKKKKKKGTPCPSKIAVASKDSACHGEGAEGGLLPKEREKARPWPEG